jgi:hypothetical protein
MCRSASEKGGPRKCPSHAHKRFAHALAEVLALELAELEAYREASKYAADLMGPTSSAHRWYQEAEREARQMRDEYGDRVDITIEDYRDAYREMLEARKKADATYAAERQALEVVKARRLIATEALNAAGICDEEADRVLTGIDRETALAPPF